MSETGSWRQTSKSVAEHNLLLLFRVIGGSQCWVAIYRDVVLWPASASALYGFAALKDSAFLMPWWKVTWVRLIVLGIGYRGRSGACAGFVWLCVCSCNAGGVLPKWIASLNAGVEDRKGQVDGGADWGMKMVSLVRIVRRSVCAWVEGDWLDRTSLLVRWRGIGEDDGGDGGLCFVFVLFCFVLFCFVLFT